MEEIYPDKCYRCGAPLNWEGSNETITCGFCGKRNYVKNYSQKQNQNISFTYKIKKIFSPLKVIFQNKIYSFLIISSTISLCAFSINGILNNPLNAYRREIQKVCRKVARTESTDFNAKTTNSDCNKYLSNMIVSLEKIYLNGQLPLSNNYKKSIKVLEDQNIYKDLYRIKKFTKGIRDTGEGFEVAYLISPSGKFNIFYDDSKYVDKQIKKECKNLQETKIFKAFHGRRYLSHESGLWSSVYSFAKQNNFIYNFEDEKFNWGGSQYGQYMVDKLLYLKKTEPNKDLFNCQKKLEKFVKAKRKIDFYGFGTL